MNIAIVGAGIVGRLLAWTLEQRGHQIHIFDRTSRDDDSITSFAAAGMLAPYAELETGEQKLFELSKDAIKRWQTILPKLRKPVSLQHEGSLLVTFASERPELEHFLERARRINVNLSILDAEGVGRLEPDLSEQPLVGMHLPEEGFLNPYEVMQALQESIEYTATSWYENIHVTDIKDNTVHCQHGAFEYDQVFDCRGMGAKGTLPNLRGVRGEIIWLECPDVKLTRPIRILHPRYPMYILPRGENRYIVGATTIESEDYSPISLLSTLELLSACYSLHPGFSEARVIHSVTQCRPAFPDHLPKIIKTKHCIHINGLYRHGYLLAPKVVAAACAHLNQPQQSREVEHASTSE